MPAARPLPASAERWRDEFFRELSELSDADEIDAGLDFAFDTIDDLLLDGRFTECNQLIANVDVTRFDPAILVGFLTITAAARDILDARPALVDAVRRRLAERTSPEELSSVMRGLE
jgi:hypothetical protein